MFLLFDKFTNKYVIRTGCHGTKKSLVYVPAFMAEAFCFIGSAVMLKAQYREVDLVIHQRLCSGEIKIYNETFVDIICYNIFLNYAVSTAMANEIHDCLTRHTNQITNKIFCFIEYKGLQSLLNFHRIVEKYFHNNTVVDYVKCRLFLVIETPELLMMVKLLSDDNLKIVKYETIGY